MAQNDSKIDTKMVPKWYQNGTKMVRRWSLGGSWGHLGGKLGPRWSQEGSKVEKERSPTPPGIPPRNLNFSFFHRQAGSQEAWRPSWITCCVQTPIFRRKGVSRDMKKQAKPLYCCSFSGFPPKWKKLLWRGVWGSILGTFWEPSWAMLGTKLA